MDMERDANWLAAYAIGLTYSQRPVRDAVHDLQLAAGMRPELLEQAQGRVQSVGLADTDTCSQAATLLAVAGLAAVGGTTPARTPLPEAS